MLLSKRFIASVMFLVLVSAESFFVSRYVSDFWKNTVIYEQKVVQTTSQQELKPEGHLTTYPQEEKVHVGKPEVVTYLVKQGDTLESISRMYGIKTNTITWSNRISQESILKVGQKLRFPSVDGILYKVDSGDTLWNISSTYNVNPDALTDINNINSPDKLEIGQEIIIPGADITKAAFAGDNAKNVNTVKSSTGIEFTSRGLSTSASSNSTWPLSGPISSRFGPRWGTVHKGIDIAVPTGTKVHAFMKGTVSFSGWESGYGYLVIINHENGLQTYYGHNSKLLVKSGQFINKGQVISKSGNTGDSTGPHLHFEIRENGEAVNPLGYLK